MEHDFAFWWKMGERKAHGDTFNTEECTLGDPGSAGRAAGLKCFWVDDPQDKKIRSRFLKTAGWASTPFVE